jgi:sugar phosphate isomerase/epimerase
MRTISASVGLALFYAALAGAPPASTKPAPARQWAVSICDGYLRGIGADDIWTAARSVGLSRIEAGVDANLACPNLFEKGGSPYRIDTPEARAVLRKKLAQERMSIGCLCMVTKLDLRGRDDDVLQRIARAAEAAPELGCRTIMLPIGVAARKDTTLTDEAFVERCKPFVKSLDAIAAKTGIQIVLENLGPFWNRREIMEPVLRESRPDRVGMLLDTTNLYWYGYPLDRIYELAQTFAPYVRYAHVKNVRYPADQRDKQRTPGWEYGRYAEPVRTGDINFARILVTLAKAGYIGDLTIEDDSLPHFDAAGKKKTIADDVAYLRDRIKELK